MHKVTIRLAELEEDIHATLIFGRSMHGTIYHLGGLDQIINMTVIGVAEYTEDEITMTYLLFDTGYAYGLFLSDGVIE